MTARVSRLFINFVSALAILLAGAALLLSAISHPPSASAATVIGSIQDINYNPYGGTVNLMQFTPLSCPQQIGTNTVWPVQSKIRLTNGLFQIQLAGGLYYAGLVGDAAVGQTPKTVKILVPPNDTNVWQFNACALLATNLPIFTWTNGFYNLLAGTNIILTTNGAFIVINAPTQSVTNVNPAMLFVTPLGNDTNSGTAELPLATLSNAVSRATAGITIVLSAGVFKCDGVRLPVGVSLAGSGIEKTTLSNSMTGIFGADQAGIWLADNIAVSDLKIVSTNQSYVVFDFPVRCPGTGATNVSFRNVEINGGTDCIFADPVTNAFSGRWVNCVFRSNWDTFSIRGLTNATATNSLNIFQACRFRALTSGVTARCIVAGVGTSVFIGCHFEAKNGTVFNNGIYGERAGVAIVRGCYFDVATVSAPSASGANVAMFDVSALNCDLSVDPASVTAAGGDYFPSGVPVITYVTDGRYIATGSDAVFNSVYCNNNGFFGSLSLPGGGNGTAFYNNTEDFLGSGAGGKTDGGNLTNLQSSRLTGSVTNAINSISGVITNNGMVWYSLKTNNTPAISAPVGSICTTTNGQLFVRSNTVWLLK